MNSRLINILILITVFLIPLLGASGDFGYEQIKVLFFILSITLIGFIWLINKPAIKWNQISVVSLLFILILLLTSIFGIDPKISLLGNPPYFQGWIVYAYLWLFSLAVAHAKIKLDKWAVCLTVSGLIVGFLAICEWVLLNIFNAPIPAYAGRVVASFGQPNFYAGFLLLILPFSYWLFKNKTGKAGFFAFTASMVMLAGIFVSYSRSAILMALILIILALIDQLHSKFKLVLIAVGVIGISIIISLKLSSGLIGNEVSKPLSTNNPDLTKVSVEKRVYIWPQAFNIVVQKPLTGYGLENISQSFVNYFEGNKVLFEGKSRISIILINLKELDIDRTHNYILDLLLFAGLPGLLTWIFLVVLLLRRSRGILLISLITYLIWIQFQNQSIVHLVYFWLLAGLINKKSVDKAETACNS